MAKNLSIRDGLNKLQKVARVMLVTSILSIVTTIFAHAIKSETTENIDLVVDIINTVVVLVFAVRLFGLFILVASYTGAFQEVMDEMRDE